MIKRLLNKIFGHTDERDSIDENISVKPGTYENINIKDLEDKYNELLELQYAQNEEIAKLRHMIHYMDKSLPRFAKSIQNLELLFNPSDITNMYFDKSSTLNYLMEYLNNKTKK